MLQERLGRPDVDWMGLLAVANHHRLTPALFSTLVRKSLLDSVPADVRAYLGELHALNVERNRRLRLQAREAIAVLNGIGTTPMLLKSTVHLLAPGTADADDCIMTDLDILVPRAVAAEAGVALRRIGYAAGGHAPHRFTYYVRPTDAGMIDLHHDILDLPGLLPGDDLWPAAQPIRREGIHFLVPSPIDQVMHRILHDEVQDRAHYHGRLSLRTTFELSRLVKAFAGRIDPAELTQRLARHRIADSFKSELLLAHRLFAAPIPEAMTFDPWVKFLCWRRLWLLRSPQSIFLNQLFGNIWINFSRSNYAPIPPGVRGALALSWWRLHYGVPKIARYLRALVSRQAP